MSTARITQDWVSAAPTRAVCEALAAGGRRALFVGGCVRNALLDMPVSDIDLATDARPEETIDLAEKAGLKAVPTGISHGTITVVAGGTPFEVTTFRRDERTDGRHAEVAFTDRLEEDAARRDFTMNALYAEPDGTVIDPIGGLPDLSAKRLRFVGIASARIREDYLRILRFFRFHAWYADPAQGLDAEGLAACAAGAEGLARVSAERVGHEMRRLLAAPGPAPAVAAMAQAGILARVLPGADATGLAPLVHLETMAGCAPDWPRRLAVLGGEDAGAHFRLSRAEAAGLAQLRAAVGSADTPTALAYRHGADLARDSCLLRAALLEEPLPLDLEGALARGAAAQFPVSAADLMPARQGAALGAALKALEAAWIASDFTLDKPALLARLT